MEKFIIISFIIKVIAIYSKRNFKAKDLKRSLFILNLCEYLHVIFTLIEIIILLV